MGAHNRYRITFRQWATLLGAALVVWTVPPTVYAQDYDLLGTVELGVTHGHYKDSPVVHAPVKDTWELSSGMRFAGNHRLTTDRVELLVDHAVSVISGASSVTGSPTDTQPGSAGAGDGSAAAVTVAHELYQGYASVHPTEWFTLRAGRQRMNWGTAYTFSVTDGLHPQHPDADIETGFDGVSFSFRPSSAVSVELATALQNVVDTGDTEDIRFGAYGTAFISPVEIGVTLVYQQRTTLRPGMVTSFPLGPVMVTGEAAVEAYDPRGEQVDYQPLWSLGTEYSWYGDVMDLSVMGEYLYNGLAKHYPETAFGDISVTSDYAGGFARRGYRYVSGGLRLSRLDSWATSHTVLTNLSDESSWVSHTLSMLQVPGIDLEVSVLWNSGKAGTEFGDLPQDFVMEFKTIVHF